jgi:ribonuclease Z
MPYDSDTLAVHPIEVPGSTPRHGDPEPIYSDENIIVYAIPITPTVDPSRFPSGSLKRKRSSSPATPSKRFGPDGSSPLLHDLMRAETFKPQELEGVLAQDWRRELVRVAFSGENSPQSLKKEKKKHQLESSAALGEGRQPRHLQEKAESEPKEQRVEDASHALSTDNSGAGSSTLFKRVQGILGFDRRLPPLVHRLPQSRFPDDATILVYVVVGPRVRGKFDVEKANALGLPRGPLYGRLARGETVSFMVDDGNGGKVERVVRPDDCIGKSERRGVSLFIRVPLYRRASYPA